ncbi:MAG: response regulator transcription factor [Candidatus Promineifilaceae bacterium]|nr:response regulator transcription factor [Candidatus Promineifilaceae bacterium]
MSNIRILIVDDHFVVRQGLAAMLTPRNGMEVVGEAENGRQAIRLERELNPDVIIMDLLMPEMDGLETTIAIKNRNPEAQILVLTSFSEDEQAASIMNAGASGFLLKDSGADELLQAIRSINSGHVIMSPTVMRAMRISDKKQESRTFTSFDLTPRELEVLQGIVDGLTNQAIAARLNISPTTVRSHVSSILSKLDVTNRTQAALFAQENKIL